MPKAKALVSDLYEALELLRPICQAGKGGGATCRFFSSRFNEPAVIVVSGWSAGCSGGDSGFNNRYPVSEEIARQLVEERLVQLLHDNEYEITRDGHRRWSALRQK